MNIAAERHYKTRSYGASPTQEMEDIQEKVEEIEGELSGSASGAAVERAREKARKKAAGIVRGALKTDHKTVKDIYQTMTWPDMTDAIKDRAIGNLPVVWSENERRYPEAFEA